MNIKQGETIDDLQLNNLLIIQKESGFKFGIDAVLLAYFAHTAKSQRTLDLCTGSGIVPLLLSAKTDTPDICGIEIQEDMADMAQRSVLLNNLDTRLHITCGDLKQPPYPKRSFDVVTCNPPYMKCGSGLVNDMNQKLISRHEICCTLEDVINTASSLLKPHGKLFLVHRPSRLVDIFHTMRIHRIEPKRMQLVQPTADKPANLVLIEGLFDGGSELNVMKPLVVYNADGTYTSELNEIYERGLL